METTPINTESTFSLSASAEQHKTSIFSQRIERIRNCCPFCGSVIISHRTKKYKATEKIYYCDHCKRPFSLTVLFTEPQRTERIRNSCPYCGSTNIAHRTRKSGYTCSNCKKSFSYPVPRTVPDSQKTGRRPIALFSTSPRTGVEA